MITFEQKGDFKKTDSFFEKMLEGVHLGRLDKFGREGVEALRDSTPLESGETANSWYYEIERENGVTKIVWSNSHVVDGCNIAVILQYGHGTRSGSWVEGQDYINEAIKPIFDRIAEAAWEEVTKA